MPLLPSGRTLFITTDHILEPKRDWFKAPEGEFWYWAPDLELNAPPFNPNDVWEAMLATAPAPTTRQEAMHHVRVAISTADGHAYWRGETIADFPKWDGFDTLDLQAWERWLDTEPVERFLDATIERCQAQAEANREATGIAKFRSNQVVQIPDDFTR